MRETVSSFFEKLSVRERRLLVVWVFAMMGIAAFILVVLVNSAIDERSEGIEQYETALRLIKERQDEYLNKSSKGGKNIKEQIEKNELKLQTFLDAEAMRFDLKINNFKEQSLPVGGKRGKEDKAAVIEESVTIEIDKADYKKFAQLVDKIHSAPELLVIKRIHIQKPRGRRGASVGSPDANPREVRVTMTISTFKKGEG